MTGAALARLGEGFTAKQRGEWPHLSQALPQLATVDDIADYLGLTHKTVSAMARDGRLPGVKVGSRWLIHVGRLRAQLEPQPDIVTSLVARSQT